MIPHLPVEYFTNDRIVMNERYKKLVNSLNSIRDGEPFYLNISGKDKVEAVSEHFALEAAATSTQFHLKVPYSQFDRLYRCSQIIAPIMTALGSNGPFFDGKQLFHETRAAWVFQTASTTKCKGENFERKENQVCFGRSENEKSELWYFDDNLKYPIFNSELVETDDEFHHLKRHNSSVWRWNRPILDGDLENGYHIRLEHRVQSAGTSVKDMTAQLAFFVGLQSYFQNHPLPHMNLDQLEASFYEATKFGLDYEIEWNGTITRILDLILNDLLKKAQLGLELLKVDSKDIDLYLNTVLKKRLESADKYSGAIYQINAFETLKDSRSLLKFYLEQQNTNTPLYCWELPKEEL